MSASHPPISRDKRKSRKPYRFSYAEAFTELILIGGGTFALAWLNLTAYGEWLVAAAVCILFIAGVWFFSSDQEPKHQNAMPFRAPDVQQ